MGITVNEIVSLLAMSEGSSASEVGRFLGFGIEIFLIDGRSVVTTGFPHQIDGRELVAAGGEFKIDVRAEREADLVVVGESGGIDFGRIAKLQIVVEEIDDVASPIAEHAAAIEMEAAPVEGVE